MSEALREVREELRELGSIPESKEPFVGLEWDTYVGNEVFPRQEPWATVDLMSLSKWGLRQNFVTSSNQKTSGVGSITGAHRHALADLLGNLTDITVVSNVSYDSTTGELKQTKRSLSRVPNASVTEDGDSVITTVVGSC